MTIILFYFLFHFFFLDERELAEEAQRSFPCITGTTVDDGEDTHVHCSGIGCELCIGPGWIYVM